MKPNLLLVLLILALPTARAATIYVPDDFLKIQWAIDAASPGDRVVVRPGLYLENVGFPGKAITLTSERGPGVTVIDGNQAGSTVVFAQGAGLDSVLEGFTITNGTGPYGGGVYIGGVGPTVAGNIIVGNTARTGGGIYSGGGSAPEIRENIIVLNKATREGGGITSDSWSSCLIVNNVIAWNKAIYHAGGGIFCGHEATPVICNCTIWENYSGCYTGAGIYVEEDFTHATVTNTILWDNEPGQQIYGAWGGSYTAQYCDVEGGCYGVGNISLDPLLVDPGLGDFHLTYDSPCKNAGVLFAVGVPPEDNEGDPRALSGPAGVDMGADEFYDHLYSTGLPVPGAAVSIKVVSYPGSSVTLGLGAGILDPPLTTPFGDLFLAPPLQGLPLGNTPADGVLVRSFFVPPGASPGLYPFQALIKPPWNPKGQLSNLFALTVR
jgi:hypothetical protein